MNPEGNAQVWFKIAKAPQYFPCKEGSPSQKRLRSSLLPSVEISNMLQSRAETSLIFHFL